MATKTRKNRLQNTAGRVRLADVAQHAHCSTATVSRVLNNPQFVTPAVRERIERAMRELGYVRNHAARMLRSQRSHVIGTVIPTLNYALYARLVEALQRRLAQAGYSLLVATSEYDLGQELEQARILLERGAEGLVLVGARHHPDLHLMIDGFGVPMIDTYVLGAGEARPSVGFDNARAAAQMVRHLIDLGHRRFAMVSGITKDNDRTSERLEGARAALQRHGLDLPANGVVERSYSVALGREAMAILLSRLSPRPTAVVCSNDILALGALLECQEQGLHVPEDLSIVGFDDVELAAQVRPPLTTIEVPADEMGTKAANFLLAKLVGEPTAAHQPVEVRLIVRQSTAPPAERRRERSAERETARRPY